MLNELVPLADILDRKGRNLSTLSPDTNIKCDFKRIKYWDIPRGSWERVVGLMDSKYNFDWKQGRRSYIYRKRNMGSWFPNYSRSPVPWWQHVIYPQRLEALPLETKLRGQTLWAFSPDFWKKEVWLCMSYFPHYMENREDILLGIILSKVFNGKYW